MSGARCVSDVRAWRITYSEFEQLYFQNPQFGFHIVRLMVRRMESNLARFSGPDVRRTPVGRACRRKCLKHWMRMNDSATVYCRFLTIWWMVLFAVLPFGVRSQHEEPDMSRGHRPRRSCGSEALVAKRSGRRLFRPSFSQASISGWNISERFSPGRIGQIPLPLERHRVLFRPLRQIC